MSAEPLEMGRILRRQRMVAARQLAELSQQDMAKALGVSRQAIKLWESGGGISNEVDVLQAWAELTGQSFEWLAFGRARRVIGRTRKYDQHKGSSRCFTVIAGEHAPVRDECSLIVAR